MNAQQRTPEVNIERLIALQAEKLSMYKRLEEIEEEEERMLSGQPNHEKMVERLTKENERNLSQLTLQVKAKQVQLERLDRQCRQLKDNVLGGLEQLNAKSNQAFQQLKERRGIYQLLNNRNS